MKNPKILIFGGGIVGIDVASQLRERSWDPLLVDSNEENLLKAQAKGIRIAQIDYTDDDKLKSVGIGEDVNVIFSMFEDDAKNVFLTISARALDPSIQVVSLTQSSDSTQKLRAAGATKVIDPYEISARKIIDLIKRPLIADAMENIVYGEKNLNMAEVEISSGCFLDGNCLEEIDISRHYNLIILGVVDRELGDEFIFATTGRDHKLDSGDVLVVIGTPREIGKFRADVAAGGSKEQEKAPTPK
jgi:voltage-gated potassium channel